jgi:hypothetical protein
MIIQYHTIGSLMLTVDLMCAPVASAQQFGTPKGDEGARVVVPPKADPTIIAAVHEASQVRPRSAAKSK